MAASNGSIPVHSKVWYFRWFSIIRHTESISIFQNASKFSISTFSAEINNQKSCCKMRFPSSKYTKMRLRPGTPLRELTALPGPLAACDEGLIVPSQNPHPCSRPCGPRVFKFRPLASKKLCIPAVYSITNLCALLRPFWSSTKRVLNAHKQQIYISQNCKLHTFKLTLIHHSKHTTFNKLFSFYITNKNQIQSRNQKQCIHGSGTWKI